jgi:hypothetical protein
LLRFFVTAIHNVSPHSIGGRLSGLFGTEQLFQSRRTPPRGKLSRPTLSLLIFNSLVESNKDGKQCSTHRSRQYTLSGVATALVMVRVPHLCGGLGFASPRQ